MSYMVARNSKLSDDRFVMRLPKEMRKRLRAAAEAESISEARFVRNLLDQSLVAVRKERPIDIMRRLGVIGMIKGGLPKDLSTNKKHFEGFGE